MARFVQLNWPADPTAPGPRSARAAFRYRAFIPDDIAHAALNLPAAIAERVARAERAILELNHNPPALGPLEVLAQRLLRAESVASSRIEGLELSQRRLARAEALQDASRDETARSVLANVAAMEKAIAIADGSTHLRTKNICAIHAVLMPFPPEGGVLRTQQSWIEGTPSTHMARPSCHRLPAKFAAWSTISAATSSATTFPPSSRPLSPMRSLKPFTRSPTAMAASGGR